MGDLDRVTLRLPVGPGALYLYVFSWSVSSTFDLSLSLSPPLRNRPSVDLRVRCAVAGGMGSSRGGRSSKQPTQFQPEAQLLLVLRRSAENVRVSE